MITMAKLIFKYQDETTVAPELVAAVNKLCADMKKDCTCTSGYRSIEKQKVINAQTLREHKGAIQKPDGSVWADGKCWASAYGSSNHCFGLALDIPDAWFKALTNTQLAKYGLIKPMAYEPWHVEFIKYRGFNQQQKAVFYFQLTHNLVADGIAGPKTKSALADVQNVISKMGVK